MLSRLVGPPSCQWMMWCDWHQAALAPHPMHAPSRAMRAERWVGLAFRRAIPRSIGADGPRKIAGRICASQASQLGSRPPLQFGQGLGADPRQLVLPTDGGLHTIPEFTVASPTERVGATTRTRLATRRSIAVVSIANTVPRGCDKTVLNIPKVAKPTLKRLPSEPTLPTPHPHPEATPEAPKPGPTHRIPTATPTQNPRKQGLPLGFPPPPPPIQVE